MQEQLNAYNSTTTILNETFQHGRHCFLLACSVCNTNWVVRLDTLKSMIKRQTNGCRVCHNRQNAKTNEKPIVQEQLLKLYDSFEIVQLDNKNWHFKCKTCLQEFTDQKYNILAKKDNACSYCRTKGIVENWIAKIPNLNLLEYIDAEKVKVQCTKCQNIWIAYKTNLARAYKTLNTNSCMRCVQVLGIGTSLEEQELLNFIQEYFPDALHRSRINDVEVDVFIPSNNVAIEYCGSYWHQKSKLKHFKKFKHCAESGVHLLTIFDWDWIQKKEFIKSKILGILGNRKKLRSNQYTIRFIDWDDASIFLNQHHLMGAGERSECCIGIFKANELVGVASFLYPRIGNARFYSEDEMELNRFASTYSCYGSLTKILNLTKLIRPSLQRIKSYADYCWSKYESNLYTIANFEFKGIKEPNYVWCKNRTVYKRNQTQKHKLHKLLGEDFHEELSETNNMELSGFYKVYDCGAGIYEYNAK